MNGRLCAVLALPAISFLGVLGTPAFASGEQDIEELKRRLDALTQVVEAQAAEIAELKEGADQTAQATTAVVDPTTIDTGPREPLGQFPDAAIVTAGDFEGSITIPSTNASMRIGGFIRAEGNYDLDNAGFQDTVSPRRIPLDGTVEDGTNQSRFHVRNSRLNLDYRRPNTAFGDIRAFVEFDLFGGGAEFINNYEVRMRHAAAQIGNVYVGQWWSYFVDIAAAPEGADYGGPMGQPVARNPGIRYATNFGEENEWRWGIGIENPAGDLTDPNDLFVSDSLPNVAGFIQLTKPWGRLRLAGLGLQLDSESDEVFAGGVNLSGRINLPALGSRDNLAFAVQSGAGFTHYYSTFSSVGLEGVIDANGEIETTDILGGYLAYQHWWTESIRSTIQASAFRFDLPTGSLADSFEEGERYAANVYWSPAEDVTFGVEYIHATQTTFDGREGDGDRIHAIARFDF